MVILLNLTVTTPIKDYLLSSPAVKATMSPKGKAFAEVSGNTSQSTYIPIPNTSSLLKRRRYQSKPHPDEAVSLPVMPKDESLAVGIGSALCSGPGGPVSDGKTIGVRKRVDAKRLPDVPQFEPFRSLYPEHTAKVGEFRSLIKEEYAVNSKMWPLV